MTISLTALVAAITITCLIFELIRDLMMYQQNSYRTERYGRWLNESKDSTSTMRLLGLVIFFISLSSLSVRSASLALTGTFSIISTWILARKKYKKPLAWTARARRIFITAITIALIVIAASILIFADLAEVTSILYITAVAALGCYCGSHIIIILAGMVLSPLEKAINRRYYNDAARRLAAMPDLKVVGITGSYGKTSTKHYLERILSEQFETLMTPGSYNTTLGVVRTIREMLKPYHEIFIAEMGAKQPGDIKEICDLVKPSTGIITAVGPQHLESFKTIERVQSTKFELADALPNDGTAIVNNDFEKIAERDVTNCRCLRYGVQNNSAVWNATNVKYTSSGTTFTATGPDGWSLEITTRLMGECNVSDLMAAIVTAHTLGVTDDKIASAIASIEPVEHRLSVKKTAGGIIILDDAFNSNPVGSRMALEVLGAMDGGRRIIITPGMIELGDEQFDANKQLGHHIAKHADIAIIVGQYNRDAISEGIKESASLAEDNVFLVDSFTQAQHKLTTLVAPGDIVLYENDLPDTFK